jgi:hypothetical protein
MSIEKKFDPFGLSICHFSPYHSLILCSKIYFVGFLSSITHANALLTNTFWYYVYNKNWWDITLFQPQMTYCLPLISWHTYEIWDFVINSLFQRDPTEGSLYRICLLYWVFVWKKVWAITHHTTILILAVWMALSVKIIFEPLIDHCNTLLSSTMNSSMVPKNSNKNSVCLEHFDRQSKL